MINIYPFMGKRVIVTCLDGTVFDGKVFDIEDASEDEDEVEDSLVMDLPDGRILGLRASEIDRIEIAE